MKTNMKKIIKMISILLVIIQLTTILFNFESVRANIKENDIVLLEADHECDSLVEYQMPSGWWSYKIVWYVYYKDKDTNKKYPAFCVEPAKEGVGTGYTEYNTTLSKETDNAIWRILNKGYMGSKYSTWNLECDDDLYSATKIALHSYKDGINPKGKYILGNRSVDGNSVEEIQRRGVKVLDVAETLYNYGLTGSEGYTPPKITIATVGDRRIETRDDQKYLVQDYKVNSNKSLKSYKVSIDSFTDRTKVLNSSNKKCVEVNDNLFKISIPIDDINADFTGNIHVYDAQVKTDPIYYAKSSIEGAQSYVTYTDGYELARTSTTLNTRANTASLEIVKIDAETKKAIPNVVFEIKDENGISLGNYTTNQNGIIKIENLKQGVIKIKEIKVDDKYIMDSEEKTVELEWGKLSKIEISNERKKGDIKISKTDFDNRKIKLEGVEFEIYNSKRELVTTAVTDNNGEAFIDDLDIGTYIIREVKTNEEYILDLEDKEVEIKWNRQTILEVENKHKKGNLKIEKVDKENNDIKLEGVEFEIYNKDKELVLTAVTNDKGEIFVENLNIGEYTLKEIKTNNKYILDKNETNFEINWNQTTQIKIENERKKGSLKIIKTSENDNYITGEAAGTPISDVEFEIRNEEGLLLDKVVTDKNGEAFLSNLDLGQYTIKETKANQNYYLNEEEFKVSIDENEENKILNITNNPIIKLPRTGF